jgi:hypothetical protein
MVIMEALSYRVLSNAFEGVSFAGKGGGIDEVDCVVKRRSITGETLPRGFGVNRFPREACDIFIK